MSIKRRKSACEVYGMFHYMLFYWIFLAVILFEVVLIIESFILFKSGYHVIAMILIGVGAFMFGKIDRILEERSIGLEADADDLYDLVLCRNRIESALRNTYRPNYYPRLSPNLRISDLNKKVIKYSQICSFCPSRLQCVLNGISCDPEAFTRAYLAYNKMPESPINIYKVLFLAHCGWILRNGRKNVKSG